MTKSTAILNVVWSVVGEPELAGGDGRLFDSLASDLGGCRLSRLVVSIISCQRKGVVDIESRGGMSKTT